MSKKKLNEQSVINELRGNSVFFPPDSPSEEPGKHPARGSVTPQEAPQGSKTTVYTSQGRPPSEISSGEVSNLSEAKGEKKRDSTTPRYRDTKIPRHQALERSTYPGMLIETIRKAVKQLGKEAATHRFTLEEKKLLRDIVYTYETRGIKTSENEVTRIAIHSLVQDYRDNNENSVLARVLEKLNG